MAIAIFAALAVVVEMSANDSETEYLGSHIAASDTWAQYQAKSVRRTVYLETAQTLIAAHGSKREIAATLAAADRMESEPGHDGMKQLAERAKELERERDLHERRRTGFEYAVRGLQISVVLISLGIATQTPIVVPLSVVLGTISTIFAVFVAFR